MLRLIYQELPKITMIVSEKMSSNNKYHVSSKTYNFYYYFRPSQCFAKFYGAFPVANVLTSDPSKLEYKLISWNVLYSLTILTLTYFMFYYESGFNFQSKTDNENISYLLQSYVIFSLVRSAITSYLCIFIHAKRMPKLIQMLDAFDTVKKDVLLVKPMRLHVQILLKSVLPFTFCSLVIFLYGQGARMVIQEISSGREGRLGADIFFGFIATWHVVPIVQFNSIANRIERNFHYINETLIKRGYYGDYFSKLPPKFDDEMWEILGQLRYLHNMLAECTKELTKCFGFFLCMEKIFIVVSSVINLCLFIFEAHHDYNLLALLMFSALFCTVSVAISYSIQKKMIRSTASFLICLVYTRKVPTLIQFLDTFDRKKEPYMNYVDVKYKRIRHHLRTIWPIAVTVSVAVFYSIQAKNLIHTLYMLKGNRIFLKIFRTDLSNYIIGGFCAWVVTGPLQYIYFAAKLARSFHEINEILIEHKFTGKYTSQKTVNFDRNSEKVLSDLRILHNMLAEATHWLNKCFGSLIAISKFFVVFAVVINISAYIYATEHDYRLIIITSVDTLYFFLMILASSAVSKKAAKVSRLFQGIPLSALNEKSQAEIKMWLMQISVDPVVVSAAGYFILDKSQTIDVLTNIATYLIVAFEYLQKGSSE